MPIEQCHFCAAPPPLVTNSRQLLCKQCNEYKGNGSLQDFDTHVHLAWYAGDYTDQQVLNITNAIKAERAKKQRKSVAKAQVTIAANRSGWQEYYASLYRKANGNFVKSFPAITTTNGLTKAIVDIINWSGGMAERTGTEGRARPDGNGAFKRIFSQNKGACDVSATILSKTVKIEVKNKYTKDRWKEHNADGSLSDQAIYRDKVLASGGIHFVAIDIDEFITFWIELLKQQEK